MSRQREGGSRASAGWVLAAALLGARASGAAAAEGAASAPDWRDQVLYFVLTDRFADGDPGNDDQHTGEFDPEDTVKYNGGDLRGIGQHLDYIRGLGATGVWLSPPVLNRWWDPRANHGGYHGYWAKDFTRVDPHLGTLADYQQLSRKLHADGLLLVQDIVLNHTADYFHYQGPWEAAKPAQNFVVEKDGTGDRGPTQPPFDRNDARDAGDRKAAIYHWTPEVRDFHDQQQTLNWQMAGLDDLNSENPVVRKALRQSYAYWIREVGVDGFRIDTALYVPRDALDDFLYADDTQAPGVMRVAKDNGRPAFHVFGEGFAIDRPYEETQARRIDALMRRDDGTPLLPGMLNFPLYGSIGDVFARGAPSAVLGYRIASMMRVHERPELMPSFLDNHDVDRFLTGGSEAGLRQGLLLLFTLPGIPTIYYGTEQGLRGQRAAMFAAGQGSGGRDRFDTGAPLYRLIASLAALRREHRVLSRGRPNVLADSAAGPGVLAYRMDAGDDSALVVFNTGDAPALLDNLELGLRPGGKLRGLFALDGNPEDAIAGMDGRLSMQLPPRSGRVYALPAPRQADGQAPVADSPIVLDPLPGATVEGDFAVSGRARPGERIALVADGELGSARRVTVARDGRWEASVDTSAMIDPQVRHRLVAWSERDGAASAPASFVVVRRWVEVADVVDPAGDDLGPRGNYRYPTDPGWGPRTLDIRRVRVETAGGALRVSVRMAALSTSWNPPNGFDHVAFNLFVQLPGQPGGVGAMPGQHDALPAGMAWHFRLRAHGWSNAMFSADGAPAQADGRASVPAAGIVVDPDNATVVFTFPAAALGHPASLSGARLLLNTWDYDGGYRPLRPEPAEQQFGGGDGSRDPLWMDASPVILLR